MVKIIEAAFDAASDTGLRPIKEPVSALNKLAVELVEKRQFGTAAIVIKRALSVEPDCASLWGNLGACLWNIHRPDEAKAALTKALEIEPDHVIALANFGLVYESLFEFEKADEYFSRALDVRPNYVDARWNRSLLRLGMGDYKRGWAEYDSRIERGKGKSYPVYDMPAWQGESLIGKKIYVPSEQGIGDTILFSRFLPWLASQSDNKPLVCLNPVLTALLWEFRDIVEFVPEGVPIPDADYHCFMGSLPYRFGLDEKDKIPADPGMIARRVAIAEAQSKITLPDPLGNQAIKIGVCWTGNPAQDRNHERSVPFGTLLDLTENPRVWLYSLQAGSASDDIHRHGADPLVLNLGPEMISKGLASAGTVLKQLDLVITCCTSIAHLAGALNVPCWVMTCADPYWVWGYGDHTYSEWWPSIRLFRQTAIDDWQPVVAQIKQAISEKF